jgi:penicillin-binding protein 2
MLNRDASNFSTRDDRRLFVLSTLATAGFLTLVLRLFFLQIVQGPDMERQAEMNSTQILPLLAPRGLVFARNGEEDETLLENAPRFSLFYSHGRKASVSVSAIEKELGERLPPFADTVRRKLMEARKTGKITRLLTNIPPPVALALMERRLFLPGVNVLVEPQRRARFGSLACHLLGYAGEVDEGELRRGVDQTLRPGQWVGKTGLEKLYDGILRGTDGGLQFEVDARGRHLQVVRRIPSTPGNDIHLTIDRRLQSVAEAGLARSGTGRGAAVAVDPQTGAILAMASAPGFDPSENLGNYLGDPALPFFNRALQGFIHPGLSSKLFPLSRPFKTNGTPVKPFFVLGPFKWGTGNSGVGANTEQKIFLGRWPIPATCIFTIWAGRSGPTSWRPPPRPLGWGKKPAWICRANPRG